jgi:hypothetical protein
MTKLTLRAGGMLLAFVAFSMPTFAQEKPPSPGKGTETASQLAVISGDITELKKKHDEILNMLQRASQTLMDLEKTVLQVQKNTSDLAALKDRLERLEERMNRTAAAVDNRRAGALGTPNMPMAMGQIELRNLYWTPITVVVDGYSYTLLPNEARYLNKQPGSFSYEVLGVQANVMRTLAAGETFTIRINR